MPDKPPVKPGKPTVPTLRRYHARIEAMVADPECFGDLLLVGVALARHFIIGPGGASTITAVCAGVFPPGRYRDARARSAVREDIRRYQPPNQNWIACAAPMVRRDGACGRHSTQTALLTNPETGERDWFGACNRQDHQTWWRKAIRENKAYLDANPAPTPAANTGGVLARHFPEVDWEGLWKALDPRWTPPPEREPLPARRFRVLMGLGEHTDDETDHHPALAVVPDASNGEELDP